MGPKRINAVQVRRWLWAAATFITVQVRRWLWAAATFITVLLLATHPELRLLVPFLDAVGLDVLLALMGMQLVTTTTAVARAARLAAWHGWLPWIRRLERVTRRQFPLSFVRGCISYAAFHWLGRPGPWLWLRAHRWLRRVRLGPRTAALA